VSSRRGPRRIRARVAAGLLCTAALAWVIYALSFVYWFHWVRGPNDFGFEITSGLLFVEGPRAVQSPGPRWPLMVIAKRAPEWRAPRWNCELRRPRHPQGSWVLRLAIQYPATLLTAVGLVLRRKKRLSTTACSACGYELQGVPDDAKCCPECGAARAK
jgi:hypothetical protein